MFLQQGVSFADREFSSLPISEYNVYRFIHGVDQMQLL
jgi:hypothetical protein